MAKVRDVIGAVLCFTCKRPCELRVNSNGTAYYNCDGTMAGESCNDHHRWGGHASRKLRATAARDGWIGPLPDDYTPPGTSEGNHYALNFEKRLEELRGKRSGDPVRTGQPGGGSDAGAELEPAPVADPAPGGSAGAADADPKPKPSGGAEPSRGRFKLGGRRRSA